MQLNVPADSQQEEQEERNPKQKKKILQRLGTMTKPRTAAADISFSMKPATCSEDADPTYRYFNFAQLITRILAACAALSASVVMGVNRETVTVLASSVMKAKYTDSPSFSYFVTANAVTCAYAVLSMPMVLWLWKEKPSPCARFSRNAFVLFALDLATVALMASATSSAAAIAYIGRQGNAHMGWLPICSEFRRFCHRVGGALIASYVALLTFLLLSLSSVLIFHRQGSRNT